MKLATICTLLFPAGTLDLGHLLPSLEKLLSCVMTPPRTPVAEG